MMGFVVYTRRRKPVYGKLPVLTYLVDYTAVGNLHVAREAHRKITHGENLLDENYSVLVAFVRRNVGQPHGLHR